MKQPQDKLTQGGIGGRAGDAPSGEFYAGPQITVQPERDAGIGEHKDLRGGNAAAGSFSAGPQVGASAKSGSGQTIPSLTRTSTSAGQGAFNAGSAFGLSSK